VSDEARPFPKSSQLARGERRYRRRVASPKQWQAIIAAKQGPCRMCFVVGGNGHVHERIEFHHIVPRDLGGDDVVDNIIGLCAYCHGEVTRRRADALDCLARRLTEAERAYAIGKLGEGALERLYGVGR